MPAPIERNEVFSTLRVVATLSRKQVHCRCYRCKRNVIAAARSLRRKRVDCQNCFPSRSQSKPAIYHTREGWLETEAA
jgi:hypothetical protein